jgi:hypothetical protein
MQRISPAHWRGFPRTRSKSSIGKTDGPGFKPVLQLRQAAVNTGFSGSTLFSSRSKLRALEMAMSSAFL